MFKKPDYFQERRSEKTIDDRSHTGGWKEYSSNEPLGPYPVVENYTVLTPKSVFLRWTQIYVITK